MQNFQTYSHGYPLNRFQKKNIEDTVAKLVRQAPYDSCINVDLEYKNKSFVGKISIKTTHKIFFAKDNNETVQSLMKSLHKKMQKQLSKWKRLRTQEEITGLHRIPTKKTNNKAA